MVKKRIFQWFTFFLLILSLMMAFNNVIIDDAPVRELAQKTVEAAAGCGKACQITGLRGERGMIHETIEYDVAPQGHYVIKCRRAMVALGDYACVVAEGKVSGAPAGSGSGSGSSSSSAPTPRPSH